MKKLHKILEKKVYLGMLFAVMIMVGFVLKNDTIADAKSRARLSFSKKTYFYVGTEDKIKIKGIRRGESIKWRTSNSTIAKVIVRRKNYAWIRICKEGDAVITATCGKRKPKKLKCRITVKSLAGQEPVVENDEIGEDDNADENGSGDVTPTPSAESSPVCEIPEYERVMNEFVEQYITDDMTEYQKMEVIARYIGGLQYEAYQSSWTQLLETGRGDCYASRIAVMQIARRLKMCAAACCSFDAHGLTIVKADGIIYAVTTGYSDDYYRILQMDDETFFKRAAENHISVTYFGY